MRKLSLLSLLLCAFPAYSQFVDNFNDGRFYTQEASRKVEWTGDVDHFRVNGSYQLQLNAPEVAGSSQLRTSSEQTLNTSWEFYVKVTASLTNSNYCKVYLTSDEEDLTGELNGLFLRIGHTDKNICLIRSGKGKPLDYLIKGKYKRLTATTTNLYVRVTLDQDGECRLYSRLEAEKDYYLEGKRTITDLSPSRYFGFVCQYTKTRNTNFHFDDFVVKPWEVNPDPGEDPDPDPEPEPDPDGPVISPGAILFSEIMANEVGNTYEYPEYVELYNNTDSTLQLEGCVFYYADKTFPLTNYDFPPRSYLVLCGLSAAGKFKSGTPVQGVASFPTLANIGKLLMLQTPDGELISWFEYDDSMYGETSKKKGGWALECIDLANLSHSADNWIASTDRTGGTPGKPNSVARANPDNTQPEILAYSVKGNRVGIRFSKPMNRELLLATDSYSIEGAMSIIGLAANFPQGTELEIELERDLQDGELFELTLTGLKDLSGNLLEETVFVIGQASSAEEGDLVINELLSNPPSGGVEYIELYNRSGKTVDLQLTSITSRKSSDNSFNKLYPLASSPYFLYPGEYIVISKNRNQVCNFFPCREEGLFIDLATMPPITNKSGTVLILNNETQEIIDEFPYQEEMHTTSTANKKGISLERIDPEEDTTNRSNWRSAGSKSGSGSPGYENKASDDPTTGETRNPGAVEVKYPDMTNPAYQIIYRFDEAGYYTSMHLFNSRGRLIETLLDNEVTKEEGTVLWSPSTKLSGGIYILYIEAVHSSGKSVRLKTPFVVKN
ncbi:lamin tail domain-containing protein [Bacteroidales bacterium OttesenSCG-928-L03]|nr:lamin tail domain-containing protein [Bacteroidales bacterium OttesenSCG-928-L03]